MRKEKKEGLEAAGWRVGTVEEFLELTPEEAEYVEMKVNLSKFLRARRREPHPDSAKSVSSQQAGHRSSSRDLQGFMSFSSRPNRNLTWDKRW